MNIGEYSVRTPVVGWLLILILVVGGLWSFQQLGKLEDPAFTIKLAKVITAYPGASAEQVRDEVAYHLEEAIQRMDQVKEIKMSLARPGLSDIQIEFRDRYRADDFPNIYDELRRRLADVRAKLPPGAQDPIIIDDFGDVYGVYLALTGSDYSWRDLWDTADQLKRELLRVPGVRKITIDGEQQEQVLIELSRQRLGELGISLEYIASVLRSQNQLVNAGRVQVGDFNLRIVPSGELTSVTELGDVLLASTDNRLIYLRDIASIRRVYEEMPQKIYFLNGQPALTLGISMQRGENVVEVGQRLQQQLSALTHLIPLGMELVPIYDQPTEVDRAVSGFVVSVGQAVAIVIVVLLAFMGLRTGIVIGAVLLITVSGTLLFMQLYGIELQRISLGALVIALGMLVDNAIVVAEGMLVRLQSGMDRIQAAREAVGKTIWALLGGTVIGILAFAPIGLSPDSTGEFVGSLFWVILIALLLSWVTAITSTPLLCALVLKPKANGDQSAAYAAAPYRIYRRLLAAAIRHRLLTVAVVSGLFVLAVIGFGQVKSAFFPESNTPLLFVDLWNPEGSHIHRTRADALKVSDFVRSLDGVEQTATVVGGPHQRFTLVYDGKELSPVYAQIIVTADSRERFAKLRPQIAEFIRTKLPDNDPIIKSMRVGPGRDSKIEVRFQGADAQVLRHLAQQAQAIMRADPEATDIRDDWRQPVKFIQPLFNQQVARQLGISREDLAASLQYAFDGRPVGLYRDGNRSLTILARAPDAERGDIGNMQDIRIWSPALKQAIPATQVISGFESRWENALLRARDRELTITAAANPTGELATPLFERLRPQIEAMPLPSGYTLAWGGEYEDAKKAQSGLFTALPLGFLLMIITSILLFGQLRQPLIIWLTVPLAIVGITSGLLLFDGAFDFMSLLGALSLVGLLIKNAIVLIDEIDQQIAAGIVPQTAILDSAVSRLRPVVLAAATTILGLIPLLPDAFFHNMSITIMVGLGFATVLTLIVVPTLYALLFRVPITTTTD